MDLFSFYGLGFREEGIPGEPHDIVRRMLLELASRHLSLDTTPVGSPERSRKLIRHPAIFKAEICGPLLYLAHKQSHEIKIGIVDGGQREASKASIDKLFGA